MDESKAYNPPCEPGEDNRKSDLCAQWKAADAAKESADWTRRSYWLVLAGTTIGFFTLAAAIAAAYFAREAARHTQASADQARRSAEAAVLANEIDRTGQRAWIDLRFEAVDDLRYAGGIALLRVRCYAKNIGHTPATNVRTAARLTLDYVPDFGGHLKNQMSAFARNFHADADQRDATGYILAPGEEIFDDFTIQLSPGIISKYLETYYGLEFYILACARYCIEGDAKPQALNTVFEIEPKEVQPKARIRREDIAMRKRSIGAYLGTRPITTDEPPNKKIGSGEQMRARMIRPKPAKNA